MAAKRIRSNAKIFPPVKGASNLLADVKRGKKVSLSEVCKVGEDLAKLELIGMTQGQRSLHSRFVNAIRDLRDRILLEENPP